MRTRLYDEVQLISSDSWLSFEYCLSVCPTDYVSVNHDRDYTLLVVYIWMCSGVNLRGEGGVGSCIVRLT